ncbi:MAG: hypothetical protein JWQ42_3951 [Edaphobacter sp.]|nr:hypothetical protein [Edaphobacter sp.]
MLRRFFLVEHSTKDAKQRYSGCHSAAGIGRPDSLANLPQRGCCSVPSFQSCMKLIRIDGTCKLQQNDKVAFTADSIWGLCRLNQTFENLIAPTENAPQDFEDARIAESLQYIAHNTQTPLASAIM